MNQEILKAIQKITITSEDGFDYQGRKWETEYFNKELQTENYYITLIFTVTVGFSSMHDYEWDETKIIEFEVYDLLGNSVNPKISKDQVANNLNIAL